MLFRARPGIVASAFGLTALGWVAAAQPEAPAPLRQAQAYLGIQFDDVPGGARVTHVVSGSPAEEGTLRVGDVIQGFAGKEVSGASALTRLIHQGRVGDRVEILLQRDGERARIEVVLGDRRAVGAPAPPPPLVEWPTPAPGDREDAPRRREREPRGIERLEQLVPRELANVPDLFWTDRPKLGVQLVEVTPELREHLGGDADRGVLISKILSGMPAERAGLEVGDLIVAVDGRPVASAQDLVQALADRDGKSFPIEIVRGRERKTVEVRFPDPAADRPTGPRV